MAPPPRRRRTGSEVAAQEQARLSRSEKSRGKSGRTLGGKDAARFSPDLASIDRFLESDDGPVAKDILTRLIQIQRRAKKNCPVDTGRLRASITYRLGKDSTGLVGEVGTNVEYATFVEFGTEGQEAQPYLRPAADEVFRFKSRQAGRSVNLIGGETPVNITGRAER